MSGYVIWGLWLALFGVVAMSRLAMFSIMLWSAPAGSRSSAPWTSAVVAIGLPLACLGLGLYALATIPANNLAEPPSALLDLLIGGFAVALVVLVVREARRWRTYLVEFRGRTLLNTKRYLEALAVYESLVKRHPKSWGIWMSTSTALFHLGRARDALGASDQALVCRLEAVNKGRVWLWKARIFTVLRQQAEAEDALQRAVKLAPQRLEPWNVAFTLLQLGRYPEALAVCERAMVDQASARRRGALAQGLELGIAATALNAMNRSAEALAAAERAIPLSPYPARARLAQAVALELLGRPEEARAAAEQGAQAADGYIASEPSVVLLADAWALKEMLLRLLGRVEEASAAGMRSQSLYARTRGEVGVNS